MTSKESNQSEFLSGFIAIVGPPNVGKSTLLNRLLGTKVAIVTPKPQTTRNRVLGIYHGDGYQMVFMDTPGIHKTRTPLHKSMVASAQEACREVDIIMMMMEMLHPDDPDISLILKNLKRYIIYAYSGFLGNMKTGRLDSSPKLAAGQCLIIQLL